MIAFASAFVPLSPAPSSVVTAQRHPRTQVVLFVRTLRADPPGRRAERWNARPRGEGLRGASRAWVERELGPSHACETIRNPEPWGGSVEHLLLPCRARDERHYSVNGTGERYYALSIRYRLGRVSEARWDSWTGVLYQ